MQQDQPPKHFDPYDPWMTPLGVWAKRHFYTGRLIGKLSSIVIALADWLLPGLSRQCYGATARYYPISYSLWLLSQDTVEDPQTALNQLLSLSVDKNDNYGTCWGLGFPWMSKNGLYGENIPFITHTPYAMEALLKLAQYPSVHADAMRVFNSSDKFLNSLKVMYEDDTQLALSYSPLDEPRIVVNANAYACYALALYSVNNVQHSNLSHRALKIVQWICQQQLDNGSWYYYADTDAGNFIDCFHSCFVIKNLIKTRSLLPEISDIVGAPIIKGIAYLENNFYNAKAGLVKRFTERDIKDPFVWDLYDQAEYLGILIDSNQIDFAIQFEQNITATFYKNENWYCRKDFLGRLWGKNFYRWGIAPFLYQRKRLQNIIKGINK